MLVRGNSKWLKEMHDAAERIGIHSTWEDTMNYREWTCKKMEGGIYHILFECESTEDDLWPITHDKRPRSMLQVNDILADKSRENKDYLKRIFMKWEDGVKRSEEVVVSKAKPLPMRRGT